MPQAIPTIGRPQVDDRRCAAKRGYGHQWRIFRARVLAYRPLCEDCQQPATDVHHKVKVRADRHLLFSEANVMVLCKRCHQLRTARGE